MLARLEAIDGVVLAEVDRRGELLRLRVSSDQALQDAIATLRDLGYGTDALDEDPSVERWYGRDTVRELSREEGHVIAGRVVPAFTRERGVPPSTAAALEEVVAQALYSCFAARTLDAGMVPGALRRECVSAVEAAARDLLRPDDAHGLAALLSAELDLVEANAEYRRSGPDPEQSLWDGTLGDGLERSEGSRPTD